MARTTGTTAKAKATRSRKAVEVKDVNVTSVETGDASEVGDVEIAKAVETDTEVSAAAVEASPETAADTIPVNVRKILRAYRRHEALYVSAKGGVFTTATKPSIRKDAILYQNPYYEK